MFNEMRKGICSNERKYSSGILNSTLYLTYQLYGIESNETYGLMMIESSQYNSHFSIHMSGCNRCRPWRTK
ncbi:hypothetical protein DERP_005029 [Dermatophagoides pteronyssinus]|uniref:Uncharacterized protein n=1 Tax=Dermatophagoides pteronyssinus TaxID=6956 RepID=A0ABQ8JT66_DERPT|nr:hypothetical protein DERP_005029 [Dermatophagoides pteronyssinus]